jgi:hypothetical protein
VRVQIDVKGIRRRELAVELGVREVDLLLDELAERDRVDEAQVEVVGERALEIAREREVLGARRSGLMDQRARDVEAGG